MRYQFSCLPVLFCGAVFAPVTLHSESALLLPYVAVSKQTVYIAEPGKPDVVKDVLRQTEARDSHGRRYTSAQPDVPTRFQQEWIRDVVAGKSYRVNRQQKVAYYTNMDPARCCSVPEQAKSAMKEVEINGVRCLAGPVSESTPDGGDQVVGTSCVAFELGMLTVREDVKRNYAGENLRIVTELEDFQLGTEPPEEWFRVPEDFQLVLASPGKPVLKD